MPDPATRQIYFSIARPPVAIIALASVILLAIGASSLAAPSDELPHPRNEVILEVSGNLTRMNDGGTAKFDRTMLEGIGITTIHTSTPWTDGIKEFRGVLLQDVLSHCGAEGETIQAKALNDYAIDIPMDDLESYPILLAFESDGEPLTLRDKGPLWIIYPLDDHKSLRGRMTERKMVWQLKELLVR